MCFGGAGKSSGKANQANQAAMNANAQMAAQQRADEQDRQNRVNSAISGINSIFSGFDNNFYDAKSKSYLDYYKPQLEQQYGQAKDETLYQLARQGLGNSSAGAKVYGDLATDYGNRQQELQSKATGYAQDARSQVEQQRNSLVNQATATANPQAASSAANNAVGSLQMMQPSGGYSPLAGLFNTFAGAAAGGLQNYAYGNNGGLLGQVFKTGSSGGNASRVVKTN
jgi:hypothetical protein